jgi:hypothetical protein
MKLAKQRHAFRLLGLFRDWPIDDRQPLIDQLVACPGLFFSRSTSPLTANQEMRWGARYGHSMSFKRLPFTSRTGMPWIA